MLIRTLTALALLSTFAGTSHAIRVTDPSGRIVYGEFYEVKDMRGRHLYNMNVHNGRDGRAPGVNYTPIRGGLPANQLPPNTRR